MVSRNNSITTVLPPPGLQHKTEVTSWYERVLRLPALAELGAETADLKSREPGASVGGIQSLDVCG